MKSQSPISNINGFTLIELLVTIIIMGTIAAMAVPNLNKQISQVKTREAANLFESALKESRSQALINQSPVTLTLDTTNKKITISDGTTKVYNFDSSVNIIQEGDAPLSITFTQSKRAYPGANVTSGTTMTTNVGYGFCFNAGLIKTIVRVDGDSNVSLNESTVSGSCS